MLLDLVDAKLSEISVNFGLQVGLGPYSLDSHWVGHGATHNTDAVIHLLQFPFSQWRSSRLIVTLQQRLEDNVWQPQVSKCNAVPSEQSGGSTLFEFAFFAPAFITQNMIGLQQRVYGHTKVLSPLLMDNLSHPDRITLKWRQRGGVYHKSITLRLLYCRRMSHCN